MNEGKKHSTISKKLVKNSPILALHDPELPDIITLDALGDGLGIALDKKAKMEN